MRPVSTFFNIQLLNSRHGTTYITLLILTSFQMVVHYAIDLQKSLFSPSVQRKQSYSICFRLSNNYLSNS